MGIISELCCHWAESVLRWGWEGSTSLIVGQYSDYSWTANFQATSPTQAGIGCDLKVCVFRLLSPGSTDLSSSRTPTYSARLRLYKVIRNNWIYAVRLGQRNFTLLQGLACCTRALLVNGHRNLHSEQFPWYVPPPSATLKMHKHAKGTMKTIQAKNHYFSDFKLDQPILWTYTSNKVRYSKTYMEHNFDNTDNGDWTRSKMRTLHFYS